MNASKRPSKVGWGMGDGGWGMGDGGWGMGGGGWGVGVGRVKLGLILDCLSLLSYKGSIFSLRSIFIIFIDMLTYIIYT